MQPSNESHTNAPIVPGRLQIYTTAVVCLSSAIAFFWIAHELGNDFASQFAKIHPGMSKAEVRDLIGEPTRVFERVESEMAAFEALMNVLGFDADRWFYDFYDNRIDYVRMYSVIFDRDGNVTRTKQRWMRLSMPRARRSSPDGFETPRPNGG